MSQNQDASSFIMGVGIPSAKWPTVGTSITGVVDREPELQQQTDFDDNTPLTWADGRPRMQAKVVLRTEQRDPEIPDDDGTRAIYVRSNLQKAVAAAVRATGAAKLEIGGRLTVIFSGEGPKEGKKNPPKLFTAKYEPPDPVAQAADQPPPAGPPGGGTTQTGAENLPPAGIDPAKWAVLSPEQKATLRAALGQPY
jgi:hypothetical protein